MAYKANYRVETSESVGVPAASESVSEDPETAAKETSAVPTGRPNPWDTLRIIGPIISTIAEKPGFLSGSKNDAVRAVDEAGTVVVREANLLRERMTNLRMGASIEAVTGLFDAAWKQWESASKEGTLSDAVYRFAQKLGEVDIPIENFSHLAEGILHDPVETAQKCVDMNKAFTAIITDDNPRIETDTEEKGRPFFLSRLSSVSPHIVTESWKAAEKMMYGKNGAEDVSWPEIQLWKQGDSESRKQLQQLVFAVSTQLALVRQAADDCQKASPDARKEIFGQDFQKFMKGMLTAIRNDANQVENLLKDAYAFMGENPTQSIATVMMTSMREAGDLRVKGMRYIMDNVMNHAPASTPENRAQVMQEYLSQPVLQENMSLAKTRVSEQKKILFAPLPEHVLQDIRDTSIHLMNRSAVIDGFSPLWAKKQAGKKASIEKQEGGLPAYVDALVSDIETAAEVLAERISDKGREDRAFRAVAERFLREVSRNALPDIARSQDAGHMRESHAEVLRSASEVALRVARPDLGNNAEQVVASDMKRFTEQRKTVYAGRKEEEHVQGHAHTSTTTRSPE